VCGNEDYNSLKVSFKELFNEINEVIEQAEIEVDGHKIPLEFYLSGDYKVFYIINLLNPLSRIAPSNARRFYLSRGECWCLMG
jgi:hypothetical protein